jgi:hypothetical protein
MWIGRISRNLLPISTTVPVELLTIGTLATDNWIGSFRRGLLELVLNISSSAETFNSAIINDVFRLV